MAVGTPFVVIEATLADFGVTARAIFWCYQRRDPCFVVHKGIYVTLFGLVAFEAADVSTKVLTGPPLLVKRVIVHFVTCDATRAFGTDFV